MKLRLSLLIALGGVFTVATLQASGVLSYTDWSTFISEGLAALGSGSTDTCTFTAEEDARMGEGWTGSSSSSTYNIGGTVVMDGNGHSMDGNYQTFGGYCPQYTGDLIVTNWASWSNFVQNGGLSTTQRNTTLFTVTTGSMTVSNSTFENNYFHPDLGAVVTGGLIRSYSTGSTSPSGSKYGLYITNSKFIGNTTTAPGSTSNTNASGLVICNSGTAYIEKSEFRDNAITVTFTNADRCGGAAIRNDDGGQMELVDVIFTGNKAMFGGAIYNAGADSTSSVAGSSITMTGCYFEGNGTPYNSSGNTRGGGAIYTDGYGTTLTITNTQFISNQGNNGGAIMDATAGTSGYKDAYTISGSVFKENAAAYGSGGAIYGRNYSQWKVTGSRFESNSAAAGYGGALYLDGDYVVAEVVSTDFKGNSASKGGGALYVSGKYAELSYADVEFSSNSATGSGGALYIYGNYAKSSVEGALFSGNSATGSGAAAYIGGSNNTAASFVDTDFIGNTAGGSGGALYVYKAQLVLAAEAEDVTLSGNTSGDGTGAIHLYGSGATVYLNAAEGKSMTFAGDGVSGTSAATHTVYLNSASADSDALTSGTQAAGTQGTIAFTRNADTGEGATLSNVTLVLAAGDLEMDGASLEFTLVEALGGEVAMKSVRLGEGSSFTLGEGAAAVMDDLTICLDDSSAPITVDASSLLLLRNTLTIELDNRFASASEIALDENFSLELVKMSSTDYAVSPLSLEALNVVFTYGGEEVAYTGLAVDEETLVQSGYITFLATPAVAIPEPATATLSLLALSLLVGRRRRAA